MASEEESVEAPRRCHRKPWWRTGDANERSLWQWQKAVERARARGYYISLQTMLPRRVAWNNRRKAARA